MHSFIQSLQNPNLINNLGYLNLQAKIKLHFIALYCTGVNFKHQGDLSLMWS